MTLRDDILTQARARRGIPYRLDPPPDGVNNLDCSLFVLKVLEAVGIPLRGVRTAEQIRQATIPIDFSEVKLGDLLFFENTYDAAGPAGPDGRIASHIGFSFGAGSRRMYDANDAHGVGETNIGTAYWQERLFDARRPPGLIDTASEPTTEMPRGIDVASHQGNPDWAAVAASGIRFAITKATGGTGYTNPTFARNWREIKAKGMVRGAYHYAFEPTVNDYPGAGPEAEAAYFLSVVQGQGLEPGDLLALDLEEGMGQLGDWTIRFLRHIEERVGFKPLLYTSAGFINSHGIARVPGIEAYPLWLASWGVEHPIPPAPWVSVPFWQHSAEGQVPGIAGDVDLDQFMGPADQIAAFGKPGGVIAQPPPTPTPSPAVVQSGVFKGMTLEQLQERAEALVGANAYLGDLMADGLRKLADEAERVRVEQVGPRPK